MKGFAFAAWITKSCTSQIFKVYCLMIWINPSLNCTLVFGITPAVEYFPKPVMMEWMSLGDSSLTPATITFHGVMSRRLSISPDDAIVKREFKYKYYVVINKDGECLSNFSSSNTCIGCYCLVFKYDILVIAYGLLLIYRL